MSDSCHVSRQGKPNKLSAPRHVRRFGWKPDLPDARDLLAVVPERRVYPKLVDLRSTGLLPSVYDQGDLGSCTANAIAGAYEFMQKKDGFTDYVPSRLFIYYGERVLENTVSEDSGAEIRDGMKVIACIGVPHEELWPYDVDKFTDKPSKEAYADALKHQCIQYRRVAVHQNSVMGVLADGFPVAIGFTVYESFESEAVAKTGIMPVPGPNEQVLGGHAVLVVGYQTMRGQCYAIVRNSWGSGWGDGGYFYMPMDWLCNVNHADDFWTVKKVEA